MARPGRTAGTVPSHEIREWRCVITLPSTQPSELRAAVRIGPNYLVMEFVDGTPIAPADDMRRLLDPAMQVAEGLAAAQAAGLLHRDLKPDNILVSGPASAPPHRVNILDFRLAKSATASEVDVTRMTRHTESGHDRRLGAVFADPVARPPFTSGVPSRVRPRLWGTMTVVPAQEMVPVPVAVTVTV